MNDPDRTDDQLRELFGPHRDATASYATEADLTAARSRSIAGQRGRVLGGTAAVALLAVGGGALALTGGETGSSDIVRSAAIDEAAANADGPTADRVQVTSTEQSNEAALADGPAANDDEIDAWLADFPIPPVFDMATFPAFPVFDLEDATSGDGLPRFQVEFDRFFEAQRSAVEEWGGEIVEWFDDRPDGDIVIGTDRLFEASTLNDFIGDDLAEIDPEFDIGLEKLEGIEITIGDDSIEIDIDGDGVADEVIELSEIEDAWQKIGGLDLDELIGDLESNGIDLERLDIGQLLEDLRTEFDGMGAGKFDLDELLKAFDLDRIEWERGTLPDLSELELPDGVELPTDEEIDELLEKIETEFGDLDLGEFDLEDFDLEYFDLGDFDLGDLLDSDQFDKTLDELFGN
ncbi:MAG: hypothetical protein AB8G26_08390 [Ilumatobacter sp.]